MERRTGQSTRIIDQAIQTLFTIGEATVIDYVFDGSKKYDSSDHTFNRLLKRLESEHGYMMGKNFSINKSSHTIYFSDGCSQWEPDAKQRQVARQKERYYDVLEEKSNKTKGGLFL